MSNVLRLCLVSHTLSPVLRLHSLSPVLTSLFLVSCHLSQVSVPCLSAFVSCLTGFVPCFPYSFLRPPTHINCHSVPFSVTLFHCSCPLFLCLPSSVPRLMSSVSCLMSSVLCFSYLRESEFFLVRYSTRTYRHLWLVLLEGWLWADLSG